MCVKACSLEANGEGMIGRGRLLEGQSDDDSIAMFWTCDSLDSLEDNSGTRN